jgi:hypothetical protein
MTDQIDTELYHTKLYLSPEKMIFTKRTVAQTVCFNEDVVSVFDDMVCRSIPCIGKC